MIEIRFDDNDQLGLLSALSGKPTMNNNCYYIAGRSATFTDTRPGSILESAGLSAWQSHIGGDSGSIEADPALGADYMPTNPLCAGMGILPGYTAQPTPSSPAMANFKQDKIYDPGQFTDINENDWYGANQQNVIAIAYEYGLMQGSGNNFNPKGDISVAEAITVAARVHRVYSTGADDLVQSGSPWYRVYTDYAIENGIITANAFPNYSRAATRAEMAYIFSGALPKTEFPSQNTVNSLPDVDSGTPYSDAIFMLYRAGVLTGGGTQGTYNPGNNITRAEAASIISRVILPDMRASNRTYG
jgi:hypothetical protein